MKHLLALKRETNTLKHTIALRLRQVHGYVGYNVHPCHDVCLTGLKARQRPVNGAQRHCVSVKSILVTPQTQL